MKDAFPATDYQFGEEGRKVGSLVFDEPLINVLDDQSGFSEGIYKYYN